MTRRQLLYAPGTVHHIAHEIPLHSRDMIRLRQPARERRVVALTSHRMTFHSRAMTRLRQPARERRVVARYRCEARLLGAARRDRRAVRLELGCGGRRLEAGERGEDARECVRACACDFVTLCRASRAGRITRR